MNIHPRLLFWEVQRFIAAGPNCHLPASYSNQFTMASLINALGTAVSPYVLPVVEKNVVPDFVVRFGESSCTFW